MQSTERPAQDIFKDFFGEDDLVRATQCKNQYIHVVSLLYTLFEAHAFLKCSTNLASKYHQNHFCVQIGKCIPLCILKDGVLHMH